MTSIDRAIRAHAKTLTLAFGAVVVTATTLAFTLPTSSPLGSSKKDLPRESSYHDPPGDPDKWNLQQIREFLKQRYVYPADDATREDLLKLVHELRR